jgi:hypothetical protein
VSCRVEAARGPTGAYPTGGPQAASFYWAQRAGSIGEDVFVVAKRVPEIPRLFHSSFPVDSLRPGCRFIRLTTWVTWVVVALYNSNYAQAFHLCNANNGNGNSLVKCRKPSSSCILPTCSSVTISPRGASPGTPPRRPGAPPTMALDAACAEAGRFPGEIAAGRQTRDLALTSGVREIAETAAEGIARYESSQPCRQE